MKNKLITPMLLLLVTLIAFAGVLPEAAAFWDTSDDNDNIQTQAPTQRQAPSDVNNDPTPPLERSPADDPERSPRDSRPWLPPWLPTWLIEFFGG